MFYKAVDKCRNAAPKLLAHHGGEDRVSYSTGLVARLDFWPFSVGPDQVVNDFSIAFVG